MQFFIIFILLAFSVVASDTEKILSDLEHTLGYLDRALNEPELDPKKLSVLSQRIKNIKKNMVTLSSQKQGNYSYSNLIEIFVSSMNDKKNPPAVLKETDHKEYRKEYQKVYQKISQKKGKAFAERYMNDAVNLMDRHNINTEDQIRFLKRIDEIWN
jgi:DNA repair ATPase RecN